MKELTKFIKWTDRNRKGRGLLCHIYEAENGKQKQYYTKSGYAYFNMLCESSDWIVRGTTDHGITSQRGKTSQVPCLNCYKVDEKFHEALEKHANETKRKYEVGIILNKRELRNHFGENNVVDVKLWDYRQQRPSPDECWLYDIATARKKLWPFNLCDVVRIKIPYSNVYDIPITLIPQSAIMGLLVKQEGHDEKGILKLLTKKKWDQIEDFEFFPVL